MRVIGLTGVPGTGKTTTAARLSEEIAVVDANELAGQVDAIDGEDEDRQSALVDEARLADRARDALPEGPVVVEGHLAHHCSPDAVVLLRCHPEELRDRLAGRGWPEAKVEENVMAETLDALVPEIHAPARELDTTDIDPRDAARTLATVLEEQDLDVAGLESLGTADWTDTLHAEGSR